ncbi:hypothetical protein PSTT_16305 [Puccinia striiformis]|uniref:4a-hydroxytetrahydrobiopterin dehydratase n=1 Tax=Puccinia striiformis TaxID=27350 RepID=A0A2S4UDI1_9BASI|nr:hypothetical protein PSTT_16305 [Puccinia striiformis]
MRTQISREESTKAKMPGPMINLPPTSFLEPTLPAKASKRHSAVTGTSLAGSGWRIDDITLPDQSAVVVLRKDFPANQPFRSWHEILDWLQNDVRPIADELDHHPDISITQFNHLRLTLFTHSLQAITPRDFRLAVQIEESIPQKRRVF